MQGGRILMNCLSSRSGGALSYIRHITAPLAAALADRGWQLMLLLRDEQTALLEGLDVNLLVPPVGGREGLRRHLWEVRHIPDLVRSGGFDVFYTPYQIGVAVPGVRSVAMLRNMEPFFHRDYRYAPYTRLRNVALTRETGRFLRQADHVIAVSEFAASVAVERMRVPRQRLSVVYHGRGEAFTPQSAPDDRERLRAVGAPASFLFTCGSLLPYRRLEDVIAAYGQAELGPDAPPLLVAGTGADPRYRRLIDEAVRASPRADSIRLLGHVSSALMQALYRHAACVVMATEVEACPNIAIEALASGSRIVAADVPVLREMLAEAAVYYPARDVHALAACLAGAVKGGRCRTTERSKVIAAAARFSWESCARRTAVILTDL